MKSGSQLSNLSSISFKLCPQRGDGSELFRHSVMLSQPNEREIQICDIPDQDNQDSFNGVSMLERIMLPHQNNFVSNWTLFKQGGMSQQEEEERHSENQNQPPKCQITHPHSPSYNLRTKPIKSVALHYNKKRIKARRTYSSGRQKSQDSQEDLELDSQRKNRMKNETKNIPKNYGKAIITFIQKSNEIVEQVTKSLGVDNSSFLSDLKIRKKTINTIADLRSLWVNYQFADVMRILSILFLRKYSLHYIFNSRICNYSSHIKYRQRLCEALQAPDSFKHIKDY